MTENFLEKNQNTPYSSISTFIPMKLNNSKILENCHKYNKTEELDMVKTVYKLLPGSYTLLILNLFANAGVIYLDIINIFVWQLIPKKWISILLSITLKAFSSAKLGFSFFNFTNDCLSPIKFFSFFYYVYIVYSIAYLIVWVLLIGAIVGFSIFLGRAIQRRKLHTGLDPRHFPITHRPGEKKAFIFLMSVVIFVTAATLILLMLCGLIGFIIFKIIWIMDSMTSLVPAITSVISLIGGSVI